MHNQPRTLGYSLGALQQLAGLIDRNPKMLSRFVATRADQDYLRQGLGQAILQLQFVRENETAIKAALAAMKAAQLQAQQQAEGVQSEPESVAS